MNTFSRSQTPTSLADARVGLVLLFVVGVVNYIDRSIFAILQVPIKSELHLSDTQLGALTGISFALFYTLLALPIARIADRVSRRLVICMALLVWSAMTALCGVATGFLTLLVLRMGVAAGEAGCAPTSHALISDFFPPGNRATAIAIWGLSLPVGYMAGYASGGWLSEALDWRQAFIIVGGFGVVLAPIVLLVLKEPPRGQFDAPDVKHFQPPPLREAVGHLMQSRVFTLAAVGGALHAYTLHTLFNWNAPFFSRVHGASMGDIAAYLSLCVGVGGGIGTFFGGWIADRLANHDVRWMMWTPALASIVAAPLSLGQYFVPSVGSSFALAGLAFLTLSIYQAPLVATAQSIVGPGVRAFASAALVMTVNILGMGLGPFVTGALSDIFSDGFGLGNESLRYAMSTSVLFTLAAGWLFYRSARYLPDEFPVQTAVARAR